MSKPPKVPRRNPLYSMLILALICVVIGVAAWTANPPPALSLNSIVTPTYAPPFAFVKIAKPAVAHTALPTSIPETITLPTASQTLTTSQPTNDPNLTTTQTASQTSESMVSAERRDLMGRLFGSTRFLWMHRAGNQRSAAAI